jgi:hypothetical protein
MGMRRRRRTVLLRQGMRRRRRAVLLRQGMIQLMVRVRRRRRRRAIVMILLGRRLEVLLLMHRQHRTKVLMMKHRRRRPWGRSRQRPVGLESRVDETQRHNLAGLGTHFFRKPQLFRFVAALLDRPAAEDGSDPKHPLPGHPALGLYGLVPSLRARWRRPCLGGGRIPQASACRGQ